MYKRQEQEQNQHLRYETKYSANTGNNTVKNQMCIRDRANSDGTLGHWIVESMKRGSKLMVMDPKLTWVAGKADVWFQVRPGTDAALALALCNVIIEEGLEAVSYTHLDVYKRQGLGTRLRTGGKMHRTLSTRRYNAWKTPTFQWQNA